MERIDEHPVERHRRDALEVVRPLRHRSGQQREQVGRVPASVAALLRCRDPALRPAHNRWVKSRARRKEHQTAVLSPSAAHAMCWLTLFGSGVGQAGGGRCRQRSFVRRIGRATLSACQRWRAGGRTGGYARRYCPRGLAAVARAGGQPPRTGPCVCPPDQPALRAARRAICRCQRRTLVRAGTWLVRRVDLAGSELDAEIQAAPDDALVPPGWRNW